MLISKGYNISINKYQQKSILTHMSELNSSLIGYLKKKSLFAESPNKMIINRQRSKQKRSVIDGRSPARQKELLHTPNSQSSKNLQQQQTSFRNFRGETQSELGLGHQSMQVEKQSRFNNFNNSYQSGGGGAYSPSTRQQGQSQGEKRNFNFQSTNPKTLNMNMSSRQEQSANLWTGLVSYANSFQSSRIESAQCLQTMSIKLQAELSSINYKIDVFHSKMVQMINKEFASAKQKIYAIVNKVFEQSQQQIRLYIKSQQQTLAHELLQMRETLTKESQKVQLMKQEINKPNWRKVAGELLSTELEQKIELLLGKSRGIDVRNWEVGDLGITRVAMLEGQLRDMVRLNPR